MDAWQYIRNVVTAGPRRCRGALTKPDERLQTHPAFPAQPFGTAHRGASKQHRPPLAQSNPHRAVNWFWLLVWRNSRRPPRSRIARALRESDAIVPATTRLPGRGVGAALWGMKSPRPCDAATSSVRARLGTYRQHPGNPSASAEANQPQKPHIHRPGPYPAP